MVIITMLLMIFIFNNLSDRLQDSHSNEAQALFPEHAQLLSLKFDNQISVERIGRGYRVKGAELDDAQLNVLVNNWLGLSGIEMPPQQISTNGILIRMELAGEAAPRVFELLRTADDLWLQDYSQSRWVLLSERDVLLLPPGLLL